MAFSQETKEEELKRCGLGLCWFSGAIGMEYQQQHDLSNRSVESVLV